MRIPVKVAPGRVLLLGAASVYYLEGERGGALVRTARRKRLRSTRPLAEWEERLRGAGDPNDWEVKLDPPVNAVLPIGRTQLPAIREVLGL